jgi:hypothetical protein
VESLARADVAPKGEQDPPERDEMTLDDPVTAAH